MLATFETHESNVRTYCRSFPTVFTRARGAYLYDRASRRYIDFLAGAGALNYGHNDPVLKDALLAYVTADGVTHGLDMATAAKERFLKALHRVVLAPRNLEYKVMFPGPTGTNAVEAALKIARKATGRRTIVSFTNAFHGMTLGSLAVTGNGTKRGGAGLRLDAATILPFDGYLGAGVDTIEYARRLLEDPSSGVERPAAFIVETIQAEGGINEASREWLRALAALAHEHDALLIVDDIQVGCGRTGPFFSFEAAGIEPDVVCLSKSLSGYGLPLSVVLLRPELDLWAPGEHNGTFRGNNHAFVTATAALEHYWTSDTLAGQVQAKADVVGAWLSVIAHEHRGHVRGRGLIQGVAFDDPTLASRISRIAFTRGLIVETAGPRDEVLKLLPPLTIDTGTLAEGLRILEESARLAARPRPSLHAVRGNKGGI